MSLLSYFKPSGDKPAAKKRKITETESIPIHEEPITEILEESSPENTETKTGLSKEEIDAKVEENRKRALAIRKKKEAEKKLQTGIPSFLCEPGWRTILTPHMLGSSFDGLMRFIESEKKAGATIYPSEHLIFNALNSCPLDKVAVVILGQDPYHGPNQAMGMSFSVQTGVTVPPSLRVYLFKLR